MACTQYGGAKWGEVCSSHPDFGGTHECLAAEMRCAYCGIRLEPYPCHGCGRFLTAARMHADLVRCERCEP